jgi:hypothetical protein
MECAGYAEKRRVVTRHSKHVSGTDTVMSISASSSTEPEPQGNKSFHPKLRTDELPLIGIPNNPKSLQRPHARARDVLAYHQFFFRTMANIFPPESLSYWRDYVCQEAWEVEYVFDAIVALGSMHRATLLSSQQCENDRHQGLDTKVTAIRAYANALQGVSDNLASNQISMALLLGVLILFAYVEVKLLISLDDSPPVLIIDDILVFRRECSCYNATYPYGESLLQCDVPQEYSRSGTVQETHRAMPSGLGSHPSCHLTRSKSNRNDISAV